MEFTGPATRFTDGAIERAAAELGADIAAVRAVISVESNGGFLPDTRPKILFERHLFHRLTNGQYSDTHPGISSPRPGGYAGGAREYDRLAEAMALDRAAALKAASWGAFQILGRNHQAAGFDDVEGFVAAMSRSEDDHLQAFVRFVKANQLDDELRRRDWAGFARGYNGPNFRINRYDEKLAAAYIHHSIVSPRADPVVTRTLKMGDVGPDVAWLQERLGLTADGDFGPATKRAVKEFQSRNGLTADGIAGPRTLAKLRG